MQKRGYSAGDNVGYSEPNQFNEQEQDIEGEGEEQYMEGEGEGEEQYMEGEGEQYMEGEQNEMEGEGEQYQGDADDIEDEQNEN